MSRFTYRRKKTFVPMLEALEQRWAPALTLLQLDNDSNGSAETLQIVGDAAREIVRVEAFHDRTVVSLDNNFDWDYTDPGEIKNAIYPSFTHFDIRSGGGDDDVAFYPNGTFNSRSVNGFIDLGSGNDFFDMNDGTEPMDNSHLQVEIQAGDGDDILATDDIPWLWNGTTWDVSVYLGEGSNSIRANMDTEISGGSTMSMYFEGGSGIDDVYTRFNQDAFDTVTMNVNAVLLGGDDIFTSEVHKYFNLREDLGLAHLAVDGGEGNDVMTVVSLDDADGYGVDLKGTFDIGLTGGAGTDSLRVEFAPVDGLELDGNLLLRLNGNGGGDTLTALLKNTATSGGNYDVALYGGSEDDLLNLYLENPGAPYLEFKNSTTPALNDQFVLLDGGAGTQDLFATNVSTGVPLQTVNCELTASDTVVTVLATDKFGAEANSEPGKFTITRAGNIVTPLTVSYTMSGTAVGGPAGAGDYPALPGTMTFPIGAATATINIIPWDDLDIEALETIILTLAPSAGYSVGTPASATVKITDDDPTTLRTLTATGSVWKFLDDGTNQGTAWRNPAFDDSTWLAGHAQLGFGDGDEATILNAGKITYYFRRTFTIASAAALFTDLALSLQRDDGAVIYLNGTEVFRSNMPSGTVTYTTLASDSEPADEENLFHNASLNPAMLVDGVNTLAVEIHQTSSGSGDVSFDLSLIGTVPFSTVTLAATDGDAAEPGFNTGAFTITRVGDTSFALPVNILVSGTATNGTDYTLIPVSVIIPTGASSVTVNVAPIDDQVSEPTETVVVMLSTGLGYNLGAQTSGTVNLADDLVDATIYNLVTAGSTWKFLDDGTNQGTAWHAPGFNDAGWNSGPAKLGFGDAPQTVLASGRITYYFRKAFEATNPAQFTSLTVGLLRDDGGIVYLNGTEIFRTNMPTGTITSSTRASVGVSGVDEDTFFEMDVNPALLVNGTNVVAVEIHQVTATSADLSFNLKLVARTPIPMAEVTIAATDAAASEIGPDDATFTISRAGGDISVPLTVNYLTGGTATNGADYSSLPESITLPSGVSAVTITITPTDDGDTEDRETILLTLPSSTNYTVGAANAATASITDNDAIVSVSATDATAAEPGVDTATLTFSRSGPTTDPLTVSYTMSGTAAAGDYTAPTGTITIAAGEMSASMTITASNDNEAEDTEIVTATVASSVAYVVGTPSSADVSILDDNDPPVVNVTADDAAAGESADPGTFTFTRNGPTANPLTVNYTVTGTAASGDYDPPIQAGTVTIPAGSASVTVNVTPTDDTDPENPETVVVNLSPDAAYVLGSASATITIVDNDLPTVNVVATDASASELGPDTGTFTFTRNGPTTNSLTVTYTLGGTASGSDYTGLTGTVFIPAGATAVTVTLTPVADALVEVTESVITTVTAAGTYGVGTSGSAAIGIQEYRKLIPMGATWKYLDNGSNQGTTWRNPGFNDATWSSGTAQLGFGDGDEAKVITSGKVTYYFRHAFNVADAAQLTNLKARLVRDDGAVVYLNGTEVYRNNMPSGTITYTTVASSGVSGSAENQILETNIDPGLLVHGTNVIAVEVHQSNITSSDLSFNFELLGTLLAPTVAVTTTDSSAAEQGPDPGAVTITRTGDMAGPLQVVYTLGGTATSADYIGPTGTAIIPAGSSSTTVTLTPVDDSESDGDESFIVTLSDNPTYAVGTTASATISILDNDGPRVSIATTDPSVGELGPDSGTFTITRSGSTANPLTVLYTLTGTADTSDYTGPIGSVTIPAGSTSVTITFTPVDDTEPEDPETILATLGNDSAYVVITPSSATITIANDDLPTITMIGGDYDAAEDGPDAGSITITRNGPTTNPLTVNYTLGGTADGSDYSGPTGSVTIPAGSSSTVITFTPVDDTEPEDPETVVVALSGDSAYLVGTPNGETITIADNDLPTVTISASDADAAEDGAETGTFTITRTGPTTNDLTVNFTLGGTADGSDFSGPIGSATILAGSAAVTITFSPVDDTDPEDPETIVATLASDSAYLVGTPDNDTITIADNDLPTVTITASVTDAAEEGTSAGSITITRNGPTTNPLTVNYTLGGTADGSDYSGPTGSVTIPAGSSSTVITFTPVDDTESENPETIVATLASDSGYLVGTPDSETITLADNDLPTVIISASDADAAEDGTETGTFTITRTGPTTNDLTVSFNLGGTADGSDFSGPIGSATILAGSAAVTITFSPVDDTDPEDPETIVATLAGDSAYLVGTPDNDTITIADNDLPTVTITASVTDAAEEGTSAGSITISRNGPTTNPLTVNYTLGGTADGSDYSGPTGSVTIPAGSSSTVITFTPVDDTESENPETIVATLASDSGYLVGTPDSETITLADNDLPTVIISASDADAAEDGAETGTFTITRTGPTTNDLTVNFTLGGTADGSDFSGPIGSATIPAGSAAVTITFSPVDDTDPEDPETIVATLAGDSAYLVGTPDNDTITIADNDLPTVTITASVTDAAEEGTSAGSITITRNGPTTNPLTVNYTLGGTADGSDYSGPTGSVTIPAGSSSTVITFTPVDDTESENPETIVATLASDSGYLVGTPDSETITLADNDLPTVIISASDADAAEDGAETGTFTITRNGPTTNDLTVNFTLGGTADGSDFSGPIGSATIPAGSAAVTITFSPVDDTDPEDPETIVATLASDNSYMVGTPDNDTITIADNDFPTVTITASVIDAAEEGSNAGSITITRNGPTTNPLTVNYTLGGTADGSDYSGPSGSVTIPAGSSSTVITITPVDDAEPEDPETVVVNLSSDSAYLVGTANSETITIADNDLPTVTITASDADAAEDGSEPGTFTIIRTGPTTNELTVSFTLGGTADGSDYSGLTGSVTIVAGSASAEITATPLDDLDAEDSETVLATLGSATGYIVGTPDAATMTILDNDLPTVSIAATDDTAAETDQDQGTFIVTRTGPTSAPLTVNFTLGGTADGSDYSGPGSSVTIPAGSDSATITLTPVDDVEQEGNETAVATLESSPDYHVGTTSSATITLMDNDPTVTVTVSAGTIAEHEVGTFTLFRTGDINVALDVAYTLAGTAGPGDFTGPTGTLTFDAGSASTDVAVTPVDDAEAEASETVIITLQISATYTVGPARTQTLTILDNELPLVSIVASVDTTSEGGDSGTFTVSRLGDLSTVVTVNYTLGGTADAGDITGATGFVTIAAGDISAAFSFTPVDDTEPEDTETVFVTLNSDSAYEIGASGSATAFILDNDLPTVTIAPGDDTATELAQDPGTFIISRNGPTANSLTVTYTLGGTADAGEYTGTTGSVTIAAGDSFATITATPVDDAEPEDAETVLATLEGNGAYIVGPPGLATVTIVDNDVPTVTIVADDAAGAEQDQDPVSFTISRNGPTTNDLTVTYSVSGTASGGDYESVSGSVTIPAGSSATTVTMTPVDDLDPEDAETLVVTLQNDSAYLVGVSASDTVTIVDNDLPTVSVTATDATSGEPGTDTGTITISRNGPTTNDLTVTYSVSGTAGGSDYESVSGSVTIPAGSTSTTITLTPVDDLDPEDPETMVVILQSDSAYLVGVSASDMVTIVDNDLPTVVVTATDASAAEAGTNPGTFTITRNGPTTNPLAVTYNVSGTASSSDYQPLASSVTIPAGSSSAQVTVTPVDDAAVEASESVLITLASASEYTIGAPANATVNIQDNDAPAGPLVAAGSTWKYLDNGSNQGSAWRSAAFNDTTWSSGAAKLGFGGNQATTLTTGKTTYYFRKTFTVANPAAISALTLRLLRDDGAVVYLNGTEVVRSNMPTGTITYTTKASSTIGGADESTFSPTSINPGLLLTGTNLLAVEIHQSYKTSPDLFFDMDLVIPPTVSIAATDTDLAEPSNPATFTITRNGNLSAALTVFYTVSGTASSNVDYNALSGSVIISAGSATAVTTVAPIDDLLVEGSETIIVTLSSNTSYALDSASTITLTLADNELP